MCGIAGVFSFNGPIDPARLMAANRALRHRGPDDDGVYVEPRSRAGLMQRRLAIIDLSIAGHQPMVWADSRGDVVLNFNGEIYNYRELRDECNAAAPGIVGHTVPWRGTSDTEVILWAYILWGEKAIALLDGMFAISIWDGRSRQMLLARDRFGVKPLYYSLNRDRLIFASEIKGLRVLDDLDTAIDPVAVAQYVTFLFTPGERTMFKSVLKLGPGNMIVAGEDGTTRQANFAECFPVRATDHSLTEQSATERLRYLLEVAVQRQMVADVPVGAFLSGGLDSSSIVNFARKYSKEGALKCFTIGSRVRDPSEEGWVSDLPYAQQVARHLGVDLHTIWVGPEMADQFAWMVAQMDEPNADPAALNAFFICKLAREQGIKVLLSGAGGDDIFSGYRRHDALMLERWWSWLPQPFRKTFRVAAERVGQGGPTGRRFAKAFQHADETAQGRLVGYFRWLPRGLVASLLTPEMLRAIGPEDPAEPMFSALQALPRHTPRLDQMLHLDSKFFLIDHNLHYTDKMSMAASVEVRVPFMDPNLVAFASSLPADFKQHGRIGKWIFKRAMEPHLPREVIYRPKTGFGVPLRSWLQRELRSHVDDSLAESTVKRRGIFNPREVQRLLRLDREGRIDATYPIFALMCIETWCRNYIDARPDPLATAGAVVA